MKNTIFSFLKLIIVAIIFWSFAFCLFIMIRYYQLGAEGGTAFNVYETDAIPITQWLEFGVFGGVVVGIIYALVEFIFDKLQLNKQATGLVLIEKSLIYLLMLIFSASFIIGLLEIEMDIDLPNEQGWWKNSKVFWLVVAYFIICSLIFSFLKIAKENFGRNMFFNQLIGKYRKPIEEKRIFMFLDLQASTTIAEKLGHYRYSELIQDCFYDLNRVINSCDAEIYQYVGDEAVLSWKYKKGIKNNNCVELFYKFQNRLAKKAKVYNSKFGLLPVFKAGIHGGKLIVAEVGTIKKEIAYHGDVINTAARIQGECNKYNETLLVSSNLLDQLTLNTSFTTKLIGNISLKGKEQQLKIFAINK